MFCENCGTKLEDGTIFCENCGAKVSAESFGGAYSENKNIRTSRDINCVGISTSSISKFLKMLFTDPILVMQTYSKKDYFLYGMVFLVCKSLFVALIVAMLKGTVSEYVLGFYWMYSYSVTFAFIVMFLMLIVADACWIGLIICTRKITICAYDAKRAIQLVALGQAYVPIITIAGVAMVAIFKYSGGDIALVSCIVTMAFFQYESVTTNIAYENKSKTLYGMSVAVFICAIVWVAMINIIQAIANYYIIY